MGVFERELSRPTFNSNVVLKINGVYYAQFKPDSGLVMDADKIGTVAAVNINPITVDFRDVKTSFSTLSFTLLDKDGVVSESISNDPYAWQNVEVVLFAGFLNGAFPFASYKQISVTRIKKFTKAENAYTFSAEDAQALIKKKIYNTAVEVTADFTDTASTIYVTSTTDFPSSGNIFIEGEYIGYTGKTGTSFTGCGGANRGKLGSSASAQSAGVLCYEVTTLQDNLMDIALDIILNQCGVPAALVNQTSFTDIRDGAFVGEPDYKFYVHNVDALNWLEDNVFIAANSRLYCDNNGKLSLALLDQVVYSDESVLFTEDYQIGNPSYSIDSSKIVNQINVLTDYQPGSDKFLRTQTFEDAASIAKFGTKSLELKLYGVFTSIDISNLIPPNRATRLLLRTSTPKAEIATNTFFALLNTDIGDQVYFSNRFIPQPASAIEFNQLLEVVSKAPVNLCDNAQIQWKLAFTSYTGQRVPLISPSPLITFVISQKKVTINATDAAALKIGYKMQLQDNTTRENYADAANTITDIVGNEITFLNDFSTTLTTNILLTFPNYDDSTEEQRALFCYIADADTFAYDGKSAYLIVI